MKEKQLTIGEIAELCAISTKTLRHYDKIGLLKPMQLHPENGYRLYSRKQIAQLHVIKGLQELGCSLKELKELLQIDQQHVAFDQLKQQLAVQETRLYEEQRLLQKRLDTIHRIQKELPELQPAELTIRRFPTRQLRFASTSPLSEAAFTDGFLQLEQLIAQEQTQDGSMFPSLLLSTKAQMTTVSFCTQCTLRSPCDYLLPAGDYACFTVKGSYANLGFQLQCLRQELANRCLQTLEDVFIIYYINEAVTNSEENYISEYQFKICS